MPLAYSHSPFITWLRQLARNPRTGTGIKMVADGIWEQPIAASRLGASAIDSSLNFMVLPLMIKFKFLHLIFNKLKKGNTMKQDDQLDFLADSVIAQEIAVNALLGALFKFHPEIAESFITSLEHTLINRELPSAGVKNNLNAFVAFARASQPKPATEH